MTRFLSLSLSLSLSFSGEGETAALGISETEANLRNKISRGGFTASFFVQCMMAMGVTTLRLDD